MPLAAILAAPLARRIEGLLVRAAAGAILISGGLAALGLLPRAGWLWTVPPQVLIGVGLGLTLSALTERALRTSVTGASRRLDDRVPACRRRPRPALLTPSSRRRSTGTRTRRLPPARQPFWTAAFRRSTSCGSRRTSSRKSSAGGPHAGRRPAFEGHDEPAYRSLKALVDQLDCAATNAFSSSFLLGAALALAALVPVTLAVVRR